MKKLVSALLSLFIVIGLAGCSNKQARVTSEDLYNVYMSQYEDAQLYTNVEESEHEFGYTNWINDFDESETSIVEVCFDDKDDIQDLMICYLASPEADEAQNEISVALIEGVLALYQSSVEQDNIDEIVSIIQNIISGETYTPFNSAYTTNSAAVTFDYNTFPTYLTSDMESEVTQYFDSYNMIFIRIKLS